MIYRHFVFFFIFFGHMLVPRFMNRMSSHLSNVNERSRKNVNIHSRMQTVGRPVCSVIVKLTELKRLSQIILNFDIDWHVT